MPFVHELLKYRSVAVVGMEKNCGKTECLNYILRHIPSDAPDICVTSIGLDGERTDQVTGTSKPEIILRKGMFFTTSETHYRARHLVSEIVDVSGETTALGRLITAKVALEGKVILSGAVFDGITQKMDGQHLGLRNRSYDNRWGAFPQEQCFSCSE